MERDDEPDLATREEWAAAAEAAAIGGRNADLSAASFDDDDVDEAMRPVYEAGGGEQEGFELAERDLIRNASHDDGTAFPSVTRSRPSASQTARRPSTARPTNLPSDETTGDGALPIARGATSRRACQRRPSLPCAGTCASRAATAAAT